MTRSSRASIAEMDRRIELRQSMETITERQRQVHEHSRGGRNISVILAERERYGRSGIGGVRRFRRRMRSRTADADENADAVTGLITDPKHISSKIENGGIMTGSHCNAGDRNETTTAKPFVYTNPGPAQSFLSHPIKLSSEIQSFSEYKSVVDFESSYLNHLGGQMPGNGEDNGDANEVGYSASSAVSTISVAFSPDAQTMASTHGDHTVKITCCTTGMLKSTLEGHPRTPWTVKYHPSDPHILASGCLGFQVRVWNWPTQECLNMVRLSHAIISLSFHPTGKVLAVASGSKLHLWDYLDLSNATEERGDIVINNDSSHGGSRVNVQAFMSRDPGRRERLMLQSGARGRGRISEVNHHLMLRCVHFLPSGEHVIVGGVNPSSAGNQQQRSGMSGGGITFALRLWDFDIGTVLRKNGVQARPALTNDRLFVPRALLYNDGGFDVSADGKVLCACAEYWLPNGVVCATELFPTEDDCDEELEDPSEERNNSANLESSGPSTTDDAGLATQMSTPNQPSPSKSFTPTSSSGSRKKYLSPPRQRLGSKGRKLKESRNISSDNFPVTPPNPNRSQQSLTPPSPPGRRHLGGLGQRPIQGRVPISHDAMVNNMGPIPPPPPPPPSPHTNKNSLSNSEQRGRNGRYVPHVVTISLDTSPSPAAANTAPNEDLSDQKQRRSSARPRLGELLAAAPLDGTKATGVTCVKFSPSAEYCLLGYGVRETVSQGFHPVTALYWAKGGMTHMSTMLSGEDDVNIARFHPDPGRGFVYGTKQGRVRILSPRPWNYYNC